MPVTVSRRVLGSEEFQILLMFICDETRLLTVATVTWTVHSNGTKNSALTHRGSSPHKRQLKVTTQGLVFTLESFQDLSE